MLEIPFLAFWILLYLGRDKLRLKGIAIAVAVLIALYAVFAITRIPSSLFVTALALVDVALVLIVFGGDVKIGL